MYNVVLVSHVQQSDSVVATYVFISFQILFPYSLLQNIEYSFLCYTVGPCRLFYIYWFIYINPKLLVYSSPSPIPFGNRKFVF